MKKHLDNHNERGIALLMALGFSALLTVMVMGFLTSTLIEHQAATATSLKTENTVISDSAISRFFSEVSATAELTEKVYFAPANRSDINAQNIDKFPMMAPDPGLFRFDNFVSRSSADGGFKYDINSHGEMNNNEDRYFSALAFKFASWSAPTGLKKGDDNFSLELSESESERDKNLRKMGLIGLFDTFDPSTANRVTFTVGERFVFKSNKPVFRVVYEYPIWTKNLKTRTAWGNQNWGFYGRTGESEFRSTLPGYDLRFVQPEWRYVYKPITSPTQQKSGSQLRWSTNPIQSIAGRYWYAVVPDPGRIHKSVLTDQTTTPLPRIGVSPRELQLDKTLGDNLWSGIGFRLDEDEGEESEDPNRDDSNDSGIPTSVDNSHALTKDQLSDIYRMIKPRSSDDMAIEQADEIPIQKAENSISSPATLEPVLADRYMNAGSTSAINAPKFYTYYLYNLLDFTPRSREEINEKYYVRAIKNQKVMTRANTKSEDRPKRFNLAMPGNIKDDDNIAESEWNRWVDDNLKNHGPTNTKWVDVLDNASMKNYSWNEDGGADKASLYKWNPGQGSFFFRNKLDDASNIMNQFRFLNLIGHDNEASSDQGELRGIKTRRLQIAANLIDYNDADNTPSSDSDDWFVTSPTITGNERTPYINEVNVSFVTNDYIKTARATGVNFTVSTAKNTIKMFVDAELVNFFGDDVEFDKPLYLYIKFSGKLKSKITFKQAAFPEHYGNVEYSIDPNDAIDSATLETSGGSVVDGRFTASKDVISGAAANPVGSGFIVLKFSPSKAQYQNSDSAALLEFELIYNGNGIEQSMPTTRYEYTPEISLSDFKIDRMILSEDPPESALPTPSKSYDFVRELVATATTGINYSIVSGTKESALMSAVQKTINNEAPFVFEVNDARDNLYAYAWSIKSEPRLNSIVNIDNPAYPGASRANTNTATLPSEGQTDYHYVFPSGQEETIYTVNSQPVNNPAGLLDYKIKNSPMISPAELGFIHRARPWQTIRLDRAGGEYNRPVNFNRSFGGVGNTTGTTFEDGDGGILDFVYIGDPNSRVELININTRSINIWRSLLYGVPFGDATRELGEYKFRKSISDNITKYSLDKDLPSNLKSDSGVMLEDGTVALGGITDVTKIANKISEIISRQRLFFQARTDLLRPLQEIPGSINEDAYTSDPKKLERNLLDLALTDSEVYNNSVHDKLTPKQRGAIAGRILGITEAERYPKRFNMVMVAQNIKDVGGIGNYSSGGSSTSDNNKVYLPVGEHDRSFVSDSGSAGNAIDKIGNSYTVRYCRIGEFDVMQNKATRQPLARMKDEELSARGVLYFDKITSQEKLLIRFSCTEDEKGYPVLNVVSIDNLGK